jgi:hypothetical protein
MKPAFPNHFLWVVAPFLGAVLRGDNRASRIGESCMME